MSKSEIDKIKEIAEKNIETLVPEAPVYILARAYLELEKELSFIKCAEIPVYKEEIAKLKKSREGLRTATEFYGDENNWIAAHEDYGNIIVFNKDDNGKTAREAIKSDDEIMKGE